MTARLHIAFFGSSLVSSYWNGAATYYRGLLKALARRGHRVTFYEPDAYERQQHRDMADPDWAEVVVYPGADPTAALACLERAIDEADVLVKASGIGVYDELLEAAVPAGRRPRQLAVFWDVDAPATLERIGANERDPFRAQVPRYDAVFTYGGGEPVVRGYESFGAKACIPIYNALDPETHFPCQPSARYEAALSLLANRLPDREQRIEEFFFKPASMNPGQRFLLAGSGWAGRGMPENVKDIGHLPTGEHNLFNCSALAVLNVARDSMSKVGFSPATRVFEAAGAGACLITDAWRGIEQFLEPEAEVLVAADGAQVSELLAALTPSRARAIGTAARSRILASHTYSRRAEQVEAALNGSDGIQLGVCA